MGQAHKFGVADPLCKSLGSIAVKVMVSNHMLVADKLAVVVAFITVGYTDFWDHQVQNAPHFLIQLGHLPQSFLLQPSLHMYSFYPIMLLLLFGKQQQPHNNKHKQ